uniref:Uncharacterized protein n=1 Tax=Panagrellus redivivus TaxID=6233 RepID=A0A7E5A0E2_PANRE
MNPMSQLSLALLLLAVTIATFASAQKNFPSAEVAQPYGNVEEEYLNKVPAQLYNSYGYVQAFPDGPHKFAEKRRNKFEFIRFGRR